MRDVDVFVVGAGPAGAYAAYALAKQGFTVLLAEKRPEVGVPVRCGEAAGSLAELAHFLPLAPEWMAGPIDGARLFGPSGGCVFKREGRPSEKETLTSRLIDRPIRPLFVEGFKNEVQVVATLLSHDLENDPDIVAMVGCSAALTISGIPFMGPIGGCRVGYINGEYKLNPQIDEMSTSELDLIVAGTVDGVLMVESEAKELSEEVMLGAVMFGHREFQPVIQAIIEMAERCAKEPWPMPEASALMGEVKAKIQATVGADLRQAYTETVKQTRYEKVGQLRQKAVALFADQPEAQALAPEAFGVIEYDLVRNNILDTGQRIGMDAIASLIRSNPNLHYTAELKVPRKNDYAFHIPKK